MPKLVRAPLIEVRSRVFDSGRWAGYQPRGDDIIIATYPKCGTTWMQRIVSMLVFASAEPKPVQVLSPWPDMRLFGDVNETLAAAEAQTHRRFLKSHLPYDALPVYEGAKFIHVARDGRDAAMSFYNHQANYTPGVEERFSAISLADPKFGTPYIPMKSEPARYFHEWISGEQDALGDPGASYFHVENSYWDARSDANMLLVHYNDLKRDRAGEMARIADFLEIKIAPALWPDIVEAASFEAMKRQGEALLPMAGMVWEGGSDRFLHKGTNGRWQDIAAPEDLQLYDQKANAAFSPELRRWTERGRLS
jgi:aryl sulfotransferase